MKGEGQEEGGTHCYSDKESFKIIKMTSKITMRTFHYQIYFRVALGKIILYY